MSNGTLFYVYRNGKETYKSPSLVMARKHKNLYGGDIKKNKRWDCE